MKSKIAEEYVHLPDLNWIPFPPSVSAVPFSWGHSLEAIACSTRPWRLDRYL